MDPPTDSVSTDGTQKGKDNDNLERSSEADFSLFNDVFRNDLIGNKISSYLNLADLKDVSASCRALFWMVRNSQKFNQIAKLCLNKTNLEDFGTEKENLPSSLETKMMDTFLGLGVIETDISMSTKILKFLQETPNFMKNVHTVRILDNWTGADRTEDVAMLHYIFANTSVVTLQIDRDVAIRLDLVGHLDTQTGTEYFTKLRNLEILTKKQNAFCFPTLKDNVAYFSTLPLNLQSIKIGEVGHNWSHYASVADLILANVGSIQELVLDFKQTCPWGITRFDNLRLPLLKKFSTSLTDGKAEIENFIVFMKNQPLLEELSLYVLAKYDQSLLTLIQERGSKLKKLHLLAKHFGDGENDVNWGFLADMKNLKDFALVRPKSKDWFTQHFEGTGVSFLRSLPTSLAHLKLRGVDHFWWDSDQSREIGELEKQSLLNRFPNLASVSIVHYGRRELDPDFLDKVNIAMPKLQKLEVSNIDEDALINVMVPVNLSNLEGLTDITLMGWGSTAELLGSISHKFLRNLTLVTYERGLTELDTNVAIQFLKRNPSLEKISISGNRLIRRPDLVNELKARSSRLVQVEWSTTTLMDALSEDSSDSDSNSDFEGYLTSDNESGEGA